MPRATLDTLKTSTTNRKAVLLSASCPVCKAAITVDHTLRARECGHPVQYLEKAGGLRAIQGFGDGAIQRADRRVSQFMAAITGLSQVSQVGAAGD